MRSTGAASGARRLVRFEDESGVTRFGIAADPALRTAWPLRGCPFEQLEADESRSIKISRLLAPVQPPLIVCAGLNYHGHCEETKLPVPQLPVVILKSPYSVQHPGEPIVVPACAQAKPEVDYEGELAVVLKRACKDASPQEAMDCVLGYTAANDVTARRWQGKKGGMQWSRAKSFDTFCPLGPSLVLAAGGELGDLVVETRLNGSVVQMCSTRDMIFSVGDLLSFVSQGTTLPAGTVILTGTPAGVGFARSPPVYLQAGDEVEVRVGASGILRNTVRA